MFIEQNIPVKNYLRKLRNDFLRELDDSVDSTCLGASTVLFSSLATSGVEGTIAKEPPLDLPLRNNLPLDEEAEQFPEAQELEATAEPEAEHTPPAHSAPATA